MGIIKKPQLIVYKGCSNLPKLAYHKHLDHFDFPKPFYSRKHPLIYISGKILYRLKRFK